MRARAAATHRASEATVGRTQATSHPEVTAEIGNLDARGIREEHPYEGYLHKGLETFRRADDEQLGPAPQNRADRHEGDRSRQVAPLERAETISHRIVRVT